MSARSVGEKGTWSQLYIDGQWVAPSTDASLEVFSPSTGEFVGRAPRGGPREIEQAVEAARRAFDSGRWQGLALAERVRMMRTLADRLRAEADELGRLVAMEGCTPLSQARGEVLSCANTFEYYAGVVDKIQGETIPVADDILNYTLREPLGVTAHIIPWNAPMYLFGRSVAPALAAGNTVVVKPDEHTPLSALWVAEIIDEVGLPPGVFNVVTGTGLEAGAPLSQHSMIDGITFTGSVETGKLVAKAAADNVVPVVLELGGKSPCIVFSDADLDAAMGTIAEGAVAVFRRAGQVCAAGTRLLVQDEIYDAFLEGVVDRTKSIRVGRTLDDPDVGPIVSEEQFNKVMSYIELGQTEGARLVLGGHRLDRPDLRNGFFVEPTILADVDNRSRVAQEEIFGPVLCVTRFRDDDEAVALSNDSAYGLAAQVWTGDVSRAHKVARRIQVGFVGINGQGGPPQCPAGGYKQSGYGREFGLEGLRNYTQVKNVWLKLR